MTGTHIALMAGGLCLFLAGLGVGYVFHPVASVEADIRAHIATPRHFGAMSTEALQRELSDIDRRLEALEVQ